MPFTLPAGEEATVSLVVTKPFKFAHLGLSVQEFEPASEAQPMTAACAEVALAEKWARRPVGRPPASQRATAAVQAAPDQQADVAAPEVAQVQPAATEPAAVQADLVADADAGTDAPAAD